MEIEIEIGITDSAEFWTPPYSGIRWQKNFCERYSFWNTVGTCLEQCNLIFHTFNPPY